MRSVCFVAFPSLRFPRFLFDGKQLLRPLRGGKTKQNKKNRKRRWRFRLSGHFWKGKKQLVSEGNDATALARAAAAIAIARKRKKKLLQTASTSPRPSHLHLNSQPSLVRLAEKGGGVGGGTDVVSSVC